MKNVFLRSFITIITITSCIVLLIGCGIIPALLPDPYFFRLNRISTSPILAAYNLSHIDSVEQTADNSVKIYKGGKIVLALGEAADHVTDISITPRNGTEFTMGFRTTVREYKEKKGLEFVFANNTLLIKENGKTIDEKKNVTLSKNIQERFIIVNDASEYSVQVGCDTVFRGKTILPGTEYIFLTTQNNTEINANAISVRQIRMTTPSLTQQRLSRELAESPATKDDK